MRRPENLTDEEWADYQQCQDEHDDLMAQVADREAHMEAGLIDSYDEYEFTWEYPGPAPRPENSRPAAPAANSRPQDAPGEQPPKRSDTPGPAAPRGHSGATGHGKATTTPRTANMQHNPAEQAVHELRQLSLSLRHAFEHLDLLDSTGHVPSSPQFGKIIEHVAVAQNLPRVTTQLAAESSVGLDSASDDLSRAHSKLVTAVAGTCSTAAKFARTAQASTSLVADPGAPLTPEMSNDLRSRRGPCRVASRVGGRQRSSQAPGEPPRPAALHQGDAGTGN